MSLLIFSLLKCSLSYQKIVQIEYNAKNELAYFFMTAKTLQLLVEARFIVPGSSTLHKSTHETQ